MKTLRLIFSAVMMILFSGLNYAFAQDWSKTTGTEAHKILADTTFLRATEVVMKAGEKSAMHTHPAHFFYALTECRLEIYFADGRTEFYELKAGESGASGPEGPHSTVNMSDQEARFLLVELKDRPYVEKKMGK